MIEYWFNFLGTQTPDYVDQEVYSLFKQQKNILVYNNI